MSVSLATGTCVSSPTHGYFQSPSIPSRFRPSQQYIQQPARITNAGVEGVGIWVYDYPSGTLQVYATVAQGLYTTSSTCGYSEFRYQIVFLINTLTFFYSWTWSTY